MFNKHVGTARWLALLLTMKEGCGFESTFWLWPLVVKFAYSSHACVGSLWASSNS